MAFFNDPIPREDHTERAVRMALEMRARVKELRTDWLKRDYDLDLGVGLAAGYATLGIRLSEAAKGGQIVTNQKTLSKIEDFVETEPLEELHLKGFARPVATFNIVKLKQ